jgi:hypothetical protein
MTASPSFLARLTGPERRDRAPEGHRRLKVSERPDGALAGERGGDVLAARYDRHAEYALKNFYVYFWWRAAWKLFCPPGPPRVVCFVTNGYLQGRGFRDARAPTPHLQ